MRETRVSSQQYIQYLNKKIRRSWERFATAVLVAAALLIHIFGNKDSALLLMVFCCYLAILDSRPVNDQ